MGCKFLSHDQKLDFLKKQPEELFIKVVGVMSFKDK